MKHSKIKKLVLTDGNLYYENNSAFTSMFTDDPEKAHNFYSSAFPMINFLKWEIESSTNKTPEITASKSYVFDRSKFSLKWITIIKTIKEEEFNFEGFYEDSFV